MARLVHAATYGFAAPAKGLVLDLRLAPAAWEEHRAGAALSLVPPPARLRRTVDAWGNTVDRALFARPIARLSLSMLIDVAGTPGPRPGHPPTAADLAPEPDGSPCAPRPAAGVPVCRTPDAPAAVHDRVSAELAALSHGWRFAPVPAGPDTPLAALERDRRGLCLEMSRLLVRRLRLAGIAARFVLGYALDARDRASVRERHAWVAFHDGRGWHEVDPAAPDRPCEARFATAWGPAVAAILPVRARRPSNLVTARAEWSTQIDR